ncbi:hypothetical protein [Mycolicibacterium bacteremicum]|uniref:Uncharacterized protein n=1 Tax=Mycolicibacterium bacteremicum TaxID=564198 RepID=A0A1W9Z0I2_MYCBA|nr:hypothetical protein [Mycolicibacterium bacteremicum]MCV7434818.1 hypothetical protein [Mycolicibacterium bacteremicum]ORA05805.1 hypothetical protein BST17_08610 [Mycolicibacterium bacteremicum]
MTTPTPPEGKFVTVDEAEARYEGDFPSGRRQWLMWRLFDVENALMGLVPSLRKPLDDIIADSIAAGDPGRVDRVKSLVIDKALQMYRNPFGGALAQQMQMVDDVQESRTFRGSTSAAIAFDEGELNQVRLRTRRRSKLGSIPIDPWRITC